MNGELGLRNQELLNSSKNLASVRVDLSRAYSDHAATHDDLRSEQKRSVKIDALCQDLRNQMVSQGMLLEEERARILKLEGYIERVREIDSLTHLGARPAEDVEGAV